MASINQINLDGHLIHSHSYTPVSPGATPKDITYDGFHFYTIMDDGTIDEVRIIGQTIAKEVTGSGLDQGAGIVFIDTDCFVVIGIVGVVQYLIVTRRVGLSLVPGEFYNVGTVRQQLDWNDMAVINEMSLTATNHRARTRNIGYLSTEIGANFTQNFGQGNRAVAWDGKNLWGAQNPTPSITNMPAMHEYDWSSGGRWEIMNTFNVTGLGKDTRGACFDGMHLYVIGDT